MCRPDFPAILLLLGAATAALPAAAGASSGSDIPSYYRQLDFNLTSPTAWTSAVGGFANPGVYAAMPGSELEYYLADVENDGLSGLNRWGLFLGLQNLGFGAVHQRVQTGAGALSVTDYRLALSFGNRSHSSGIALGWSRGDTDPLRRSTVIQLGSVQRFGPYLSAGLAGTFSTETADQSGLVDLAVRPLGHERVTVFGDLELPKGAALENAPWSVGAMVQPVHGISLIGRYFEDESFAVSLAYAIGGDLEGGHVRASVSPRFDGDSDHLSTNYGGRVGFPERSVAAEPLFRDSYYLELDLKGSIVHTRYKYFDSNHTLYDVLEQLEYARTDSRISGVALNLSGAEMSRGNAWEVRQKLSELQAGGKHVVVFIDEAGMTLYHVASVADRVVMDPEGMLLLPGYTLGRTFIRGMLDKIGVGIDEWRFLTYKSAMESLTRHGMSEADREQRQALVDEYYGTMTEDVARSREVSGETVDRWINDIMLVTPRRALDEGIVDVLGRWEGMKDVVEELEGSRRRLVTVEQERAHGYPSRRWGEAPEVAVVYALGECAMDTGIKARRLERLLHDLRDDRGVKAVVMRVNSPGGSGMASDVVVEALKSCREKKPVVVSQGDVAASGGYWISMYADEIVVQPTTITGSIGVIGGWLWDEGLGEKLGMEGEFVKAGEHADVFFNLRFPFVGLGLPHRPLSDEERTRVLDEMKVFYEGFVGKVATGRGMSSDEVERVAQGRVWTGIQAVDNGLADRIGGLEVAIDVAVERAGFKSRQDVEVVQYSMMGLFDKGRLNPLSLVALFGGGGAGDGGFVDTIDFVRDYDMFYLRALAKHNGRALYMLPPEYMPRENGIAPE
jgi:protease-4